MKKIIITMMLTLALFSLTAPVESYAASDPLNAKETYYTEETDYIDGDCVLTSTKNMIRRSAIMHGKDWKDITNESLRPAATMDGLMMYTFSYETGGLTYTVSCGSFSGESNEARIGEFRELLREHPEGIVVHGEWAASTGTHGVLVVGVVNGTVYAVDSSNNMGMFSEGIQKWTDTTMLDPVLVTDYWYISGVASNETAPVVDLRKLRMSIR